MKTLAHAVLLLPFVAPDGLAEPGHMHETRTVYTQGERLEYREDSRSTLWDLQGLHGGDYHRFVWKTEGSYSDGEVERAELQLLYARAWTAFFDLQFGVRYADTDGDTQAAAVAGIQGLLPYRIESDVALFLSADGDLTGRAEFEKDFLLTERWVLQPRAEFGIAFQDLPELDVDSGLASVEVGLRLRYEVTRKLAPYLGLAWQRHDRGAAGESGETTAVAGLRFWF